MAECTSCQADIIWAKTPKGRSIPLDAEPNMAGNIELRRDREGLVAVMITKNNPATPGRTLYMTHFATCPQSAQHRRRA